MLILSAFFSGMEIAFLSKNRLREEIDRKQSPMFDFIAQLFERQSGQYITTILVGNNICLVIYSLYMSIVLRFVASMAGWENMTSSGAVLFETIVSTIIILFCGEFIPKSIIKNNPNFYYKIFSPVLYCFYLFLYPLAILTTAMSYGILRLFGRKHSSGEADYTFNREDLVNLVDGESVELQQEDEDEIKLFQNALDFADLRVRDCMVSRVDVEAVDINISIEELTRRFVESKYSRIFVWRDTIDTIVGYVNSKSLFNNPACVEDVLMQVDYVAETMPLQLLLQHFIKRKASVAVVLDEFGGTAGIISMEDVLEQIFGDIEDEHDVPEGVEKRVGENEYVLSCRLEVEYLNERYYLDIEMPIWHQKPMR
jgi:CBS domain containing-hemolysin-like protein